LNALVGRLLNGTYLGETHMSKMTSRHGRLSVLPLISIAALLAIPGVASAAAGSTFHRYEVIADSRYVFSEPCPEGSAVTTSQTTVAVTAGHEDESQDGVTTLDNDYLRFGIQVAECDGTFTMDSAFSQRDADVTFTSTPKLSTAAVTGTLTTQAGEIVTVNLEWTGLGKKPVTEKNKTTFPGFSGTFEGKQRDAVATGTVVYATETVVDGSTTTADLESLEDTNVTR
jgi:hypothetical protein